MQYTNTKSYDAEDHLLVQTLPWLGSGPGHYSQSLGARWGPLGHPLQIGSTSAVSATNPFIPPPTDSQYDSLIWDDDSVLFTIHSAGQIDDLKIADFADYVPGASNPLTVWDRDTNGQIFGCHTGGAASSVGSSAFQGAGMNCGASSSSSLYHGGGGTPSAIKQELETRNPVVDGGTFHLEKGALALKQIASLLKEPNLSDQQRNALLREQEELRKAFGNNDPAQFINNNAPPTTPH